MAPAGLSAVGVEKVGRSIPSLYFSDILLI